MADEISLSHDELYERMFEVRKKLPAKDSVEFENLRKLLPLSDLGKEVRRRSKKDLFFLSKYVIGRDNNKNDMMIPHVHQRVCDLFVQKDETKSIAEQDERKERLLLYPRGGLKSTFDVCDAAQWVLNFPNIRILFYTAADDLAIGFVDAFKGFFIKRLEEPSFMNLFFPEFCVDEASKKELGNAFEFTTPMRTIKQIEATVTANSTTSTASGFHYDVMKADDAVSDRNSDNEDQCIKVTKKINLARKMLMAYGYLDRIGTRYHEVDNYGHTLETELVGDVERQSGPCWEQMDVKTSGLRILIGRAIVLKLGNESKTYDEAGEEGCHLLFPEYMNFKWLMNEFHKDEIIFEGQLNQNPRPKSHIIFDRPLLMSHTVPFKELPVNGPIAITWDFAFSEKKNRDYSTAAVGIWNDKGQLYIVDLVRAKFNPTNLAKAVVDLAAHWHPMIIGIEDAAGSKLLEPEIINQARKLNIPEVLAMCGRIDWFTPDQQKEAKKSRMASLHPWLTNDMLYFAAHLPYLEVLYSEFEKCLANSRHNDIPDAISQLPRYAPRMQQLINKNEIITMSREDAAWNLMYESGTDPFGRLGMGTISVPITPSLVDVGPAAQSAYDEIAPILGAGLTG
jgi:predicted phage terminase large subunit-like protein